MKKINPVSQWLCPLLFMTLLIVILFPARYAFADTITDPSRLILKSFPMTSSGFGGYSGTWNITLYVPSDADPSSKKELEGIITVTSSDGHDPAFLRIINLRDFKRSAEEVIVNGVNMTAYKHIIYLPLESPYDFMPEVYTAKPDADYIIGLT